MENEPPVSSREQVQSVSLPNPSGYPGTAIRVLKWFLPAGVIVAFFVGLGSAGFCLLFCSTTTIENIFIWLGLGSIGASLLYVPIISAKKISQATTRRSLVLETLGLTIIGYVIVLGITLAWLGISGHQPEGWQPSMNERMLGWIQTTVGKIQDSKRDAVNKTKFNDDSFEFVSTSSELTLINSHDALLSVTGTLSGLDKLGGSEASSQYNLVISEVAVGDMVAQGDVVKRLKGEHSALGEELFMSTLNLGAGDSQQINTSVSLPKEFAQIIKDNPNTHFKIKLELLSLSPYTYQKFNFTTLWAQEVETAPKYLGQFFKDPVHGIYFQLPEDAVKYTSIDGNGNFFTESDNNVNFTVTTNPKLSLCCEVSEFKVTQGGNMLNVDDYLNNVPWRSEIISKKVSKPGSFQLGIVEAKPTIASPYKAFVFSRYGEISVYQLTGKNSGLEGLYNQYLEIYKKMVTF
jgi:hypothetical protein